MGRHPRHPPEPRNTAAVLKPECLPERARKRGVQAPLLRPSGADVVSVFHKLLSLHVKSRRRFLVPSDMNYG